jgi:hypothetical protein
MSRDGARVALAAGPEGAQRLFVASVVRKADRAGQQMPGSVGAARWVGTSLIDVRDLAWASSVNLDVVARGAHGGPAVWQVSVDGAGEPEPFSPGGLPGPPVAVAAAYNLTPVVEAASGALRIRGSQTPWVSPQRDTTVSGHLPTYPG